jgi:hypothetical protein
MVYLTFSLDGGAGGKLTVGPFESAYLSATPNLLRSDRHARASLSAQRASGRHTAFG